jgi:hypothetical protein
VTEHEKIQEIVKIKDQVPLPLDDGRSALIVVDVQRFYEKVVKVKADVAAVLNFSPARRSRLTIWTRPRWPPMGDAQGGFSGAL